MLEWFRIADMDLSYAAHGYSLHPVPLELMCFHCQQAAEKYLKAYLLSNDSEPPKIHDLLRLNRMCMEYDERFLQLEKLCGFLTLYGIQPRYPRYIQIDENIMRLCLKYAGQVKDFTLIAELREAAQRALESETEE